LITKSPVNLSLYFSVGSAFIDTMLFLCIITSCHTQL